MTEFLVYINMITEFACMNTIRNKGVKKQVKGDNCDNFWIYSTLQKKVIDKNISENYKTVCVAPPPPGGALPIMAYMARLRPKGVPFSGSRYIKG